jgi:ABC-type phosphate transport system permease subunit
MEHKPFSTPEWRKAFRYAAEGQRWELDLTRTVVALLIPVALSFYSGRLALVVAVPCVAVFCWFLSRAVRGFLKR